MRQPNKLPKPFRRRLYIFFRDNPPQAFSNGLRRLLLDYMQKQVHTGFPVYFPGLLFSLSDLFDVLDEADSCMNPRKRAREDSNSPEA